MAIDKLKKYEGEAKEIPSLKISNLELGFFSEGKNAYIKSFDETAKKSFSVSKKGVDFHFDEPIFVTKVRAQCPPGTIDPELKFQIFGIEKNHTEDLNPESSTDQSKMTSWQINRFATGFKISSGKTSFFHDEEQIEKLVVQVLDPNDLAEVSERVKAIESFENRKQNAFGMEIAELEKRESDLIEKIAEFNSTQAAEKNVRAEEVKKHSNDLKSLKTEIESLKSEQETLNKQTKAQQESLEKLKIQFTEHEEKLKHSKNEEERVQAELSRISDRIKDRELELEKKSKEVSELTSKLRALNSDVSLFADDMAGFARQGDLQIRKYMWIVIAVLIIATGLSAISVYSTYEIFVTFVGAPALGVANLIAIKAFLLILVA
ncbi:MAG: hypothetical protein U1E10_02500, partial [Bdellovibrionales bacterium]|nr:hypothetical protein [Bdellovibrionales bacterium]